MNRVPPDEEASGTPAENVGRPVHVSGSSAVQVGDNNSQVNNNYYDQRTWAPRPGCPPLTGRRAGIIVALLLIAVVTLILSTYVFRLGAADNAAACLISIVPLGLYVFLAGLRRGDGIGERFQEDYAEALARAVWKEASSLQASYQGRHLEVSWSAADTSLTVPWDWLSAKAGRRAGRPGGANGARLSSLPSAWAANPGELAGRGDDLPAILRRVPTGRLMVLGEAGYGKTTLMHQLLSDLLEERERGDPR